MFDNMKQLNELRKMQDEFKKERLTFEDRGVSVTMNGNFEVEEIKLNPQLSIKDNSESKEFKIIKVINNSPGYHGPTSPRIIHDVPKGGIMWAKAKIGEYY